MRRLRSFDFLKNWQNAILREEKESDRFVQLLKIAQKQVDTSKWRDRLLSRLACQFETIAESLTEGKRKSTTESDIEIKAKFDEEAKDNPHRQTPGQAEAYHHSPPCTTTGQKQ